MSGGRVWVVKMRRILGVLAILELVFMMGLPCSWADEAAREESNPEIVKNYRGLQFKVPKDWPIEKVGNAIGPIPMEEYMSRKFADLTERLKKQEDAMAAMEKRLATVERRKRLNG